MGRNPARAGIGRAMSSEDARITRKRTTQDVSPDRKNPGEGVRCGDGSRVDPTPSSNEIPNRQKRRIAAAARAILEAIGDR